MPPKKNSSTNKKVITKSNNRKAKVHAKIKSASKKTKGKKKVGSKTTTQVRLQRNLLQSQRPRLLAREVGK